jgi:hypothetical protein
MANFSNPLDENFIYGYDSEKLNLRSSDNSIFHCYYSKAKYLPISFKEECIKTCHKIADVAEHLGRTPIVLLSGGLDSEVVIRSFLESGRKFKTVSHRFENNLNKHEIDYVIKLGESKNIDVNFLDLSVIEWLGSDESLKMAEISKCAYSEMLPTMKLMHEVYFNLNGLPILGNGDFYATIENNQWKYIEFEYIVAWMRYCVEMQIISSVNFFQQTPELTLSMALDPIIVSAIRENYELNLRSAKYLVYKKYWKDIELRKKYNGAELIQTVCDKINLDYLSEYKDYTSRWSMPIAQYIKNLMP